ncbi:hypothetical protein [Marinagarivorans algicola]|uniref:hypothetical protein n=1 Tax=Marinagarivorans algicola TaxID=1513270 RepID=UPI0006B63374|nr:hypothetical protein [Marinagarivorans algicola]
MSDEKDAAFNTYTANWVSRIDSMNNSLILVAGGVMSITIGAFLSATPPSLDGCSATQIRIAWALLAVSLACSIMLKFTLVISGAMVLKGWEKKVKVNEGGRIIIDSPKWIHIIAWLLGSSAALFCIIGFGLISVGAGSLL